MASSARQVRIPIAILVSLALALLLFAITAVSQAQGASGGAPPIECDKWASVSGNNNNTSATYAAPVRNVSKLMSLLQPGETGCLKAGETFVEGQTDGSSNFIFPRKENGVVTGGSGGTAAAPITVASEPGAGKEKATIKAQMWLRYDARHIVFENLKFRGDTWFGPKVNPTSGLMRPGGNMFILEGSHIQFKNNDLSWPGGICATVGGMQSQAPGMVFDGNRIHGCGTDPVIERTEADSGSHGLYVQNTLGLKITNNYIFDNNDRGVQLYPNSDGTVIQHNLLDGNGTNINIGSGEGYFSENALVRDNLITNATLPPVSGTNTSQVHGNFPDNGNTYGNLVTSNCLWYRDASLRTYDKYFDGNGYVENNNKFVDPLYKDRAAKNFELRAGSSCAGMGPQDDPVDPVAPTITDMVPANGSSTANTRPRLSATVKDDSTVLSKSNIKLYVDDALIGDAHYAYFPDTGSLWREFEPGDTSFSYSTHTIKIVATDAQGLSTTKISTFQVNADTTAPTVESAAPTGKKVPRKANATATFSETMNEASVEAPGTFTLKKGSNKTISATVTYDPTTKKATLNPTKRLSSGATYIAKVTPAAKDPAGNALDQDPNTAGDQPKSWRFKVK